MPLARHAAIKPDRRPHAVVIGSGFGGLAAAIRLGARGYRVTVLEQLDAPGGRAYVHRQDGFTFDAGPTIVTAPFLFEDLWKLCGRKLSDDVELRPISPFYRIRFDDGETFDYSGDRAAMLAEVARFSPSDVSGYERYMRASEAIFRVGFENSATPISARGWTCCGSCPTCSGSTDTAASTGWSPPISATRLRTVLSFHPLLIGGSPFRATAVYCLIAFLEQHWGVHFAMGGTGKLVDGMVDLIEGQGGAVRCGADVRASSSRTGTRRCSPQFGPEDRRFHRDIERRFGLDLPKIAAAGGAPALDRQEDRARILLDGAVRMVFRHAKAIS